MDVKVGDYVVRRSYDRDIIFKVKQIFPDENGSLSAVLKGVAIRLLADAPMEDLETLDPKETAGIIEAAEDKEIEALMSRCKSRSLWRSSEKKQDHSFFDFPGKVLHLDGDREYLNKCVEVYNKFNIPNAGLAVPEKEQPDAVGYYLEKYRPGILVITGHDSLLKGAEDLGNLDNYRSSGYFAETVRNARLYQPDPDSLVIFAGACQSCYEELIRAGANFASSPKRVFIHIFDPVLIIERIAFTSIKEVVTADEIVGGTVTGSDGVGGIETRGQFRLGYPSSLV
ncbi:MAG: sporulation peptidase YabG [Bacillota bacterium]|nr:sporulation peptidase YabG [Bacillota bacterium]